MAREAQAAAAASQKGHCSTARYSHFGSFAFQRRVLGFFFVHVSNAVATAELPEGPENHAALRNIWQDRGGASVEKLQTNLAAFGEAA